MAWRTAISVLEASVWIASTAFRTAVRTALRTERLRSRRFSDCRHRFSADLMLAKVDFLHQRAFVFLR